MFRTFTGRFSKSFHPFEYSFGKMPPSFARFASPAMSHCFRQVSRKINLVSGDALQYERRYIYDKINAEVQRYIPELLSYEVIRVGPLVKSLVVHFRLFRCGLGMMLVIHGYVIVDNVVMKVVMIMLVRVLNERRWMIVMVRKFHRFRSRPVILVWRSDAKTRIVHFVLVASVICVRRWFVGIRNLPVRRIFERWAVKRIPYSSIHWELMVKYSHTWSSMDVGGYLLIIGLDIGGSSLSSSATGPGGLYSYRPG